MRHGVLNGGKRLRPFLVLESAALFGHDGEEALRVAAALECVHCYSLIHDDLPAMDDDDLRRGQPTVHRAFDEATAILAGDSLLTLAFDIIADVPSVAPRDTTKALQRRLELVRGLARAAGLGGMAGGQALDLAAEKAAPDEAGIITLQAMKTGALFRYACEAGAIIADAAPADRERLAEFGSAIGLAFQLADDLLDLTADAGGDGQGDAQGRGGRQGDACRAAWRRMGAPPARRASSRRRTPCSNPMASAPPCCARPRHSSPGARTKFGPDYARGDTGASPCKRVCYLFRSTMQDPPAERSVAQIRLAVARSSAPMRTA